MRRKAIKIYFAMLLIVLAGLGCTKVIDLKLENNAGLLVIEGNITNAAGTQTITLSQNVPFTNTNTYPPVTGASITVTDNTGNTYAFTEMQPGTYTARRFRGVPGNTYTMTVTTGGKTYTATSTMPQPVILDSLREKRDNLNRNSNSRQITVFFKDPPSAVNQYLFVMSVNKVEVNSIFAFDDEFINGKYVNIDLLENATTIYPGDTVTVQMQCIDKPIYTYWYTLAQQKQQGPGGSVSPSNPPTNISPATLGYFSAHTTQSLTIITQ